MPNEKLMDEIMEGLDRLAEKFEQENKPMTNADRIRAMSDEDMAAFYVASLRCPPGKNLGRCEIVGVCKDCWLEWLKQPVEEGE